MMPWLSSRLARDSYETALNNELNDLSEQLKELASLCRATSAKDCYQYTPVEWISIKTWDV